MSKIEIVVLVLLFFAFISFMMICLLKQGRDSEFNYPTQRLREWKKGLAETDAIISIIGQVTDMRDRSILVGNNSVCYFDKPRRLENIRIGDYVEVVGAVFLNGDTLQLNECKIVRRSLEDTIE